jgi:hypothetical protein
MPENLQPETMSTWMRDVERRLRAVESRSVPIGMPAIRTATETTTVTSTTPVTSHTLAIPLLGRNALHVETNLYITGSAEVFLEFAQPPDFVPEATSVFTFTGTTINTLKFNWDVSDFATIGEIAFIPVRVSVTNPGDEVIVTQPIGFECDVALFNATDDGNPVFG